MRGEELKCADADVAARDPRQHRTGMRAFALHAIARGNRRERTRRRNPHRRHRFGDKELAQHGADRRFSVAVARKGSRPRSLELDVEAPAVRRDDFAEQPRAPVATMWREMAELMPGIG